MNRRGFIKGLFGLAALAVAPAMPMALAQTEQDRFLAEAATGLIQNKIFYLDGPVVLKGVRNLIIDSCVFRYKNAGNQAAITIDDCEGLFIRNCIFEQEVK